MPSTYAEKKKKKKKGRTIQQVSSPWLAPVHSSAYFLSLLTAHFKCPQYLTAHSASWISSYLMPPSFVHRAPPLPYHSLLTHLLFVWITFSYHRTSSAISSQNAFLWVYLHKSISLEVRLAGFSFWLLHLLNDLGKNYKSSLSLATKLRF